ncbi:sporulation protein YqfD [Harryflintia acetispora]|uniref:Sporulation protein YqfD n=1 Tax=Harryflintia acetispora TaxID=1849041 RepID=A0A9X8UKW0_9FIRM|nr:sporulation protein YqfD [Harryflintia acetispora]TCL44740.1 hypothetical protein EDD78_102366 [Harryflintia acetispora]
MFIRLLRYIKGVVRFSLSGGFIERFLNLCTRAGVPVWDTVRSKTGVTACTTAAGYKRLRPIAKKTGVRMRLIEKGGMPFTRFRYRKRIGLLVGALLFALFLGGMSRFIWNVEIEGAETIKEEYLLDNLRKVGVYEGAYIGSIDTLNAENQMMLLTPQLSWIAINLHASSATVEIKERQMAPELIDKKSPCNVVAARTGQIKYMEVYEGQPMLKVGDTVQEGEIIVSSYIEGTQIKERGYFTHARAKVIAEFQEDVRIAVPLREELRTPTGEVVRKRSLHLFGLDIPLHLTGAPKSPSERETETGSPKLFGVKIPLQITTDTYRLVEVHTATLSEAQAREQALEQLNQYESDFSSIGTIASKTASGRLEGEEYVVDAQFLLQQDIARQKEIDVVEEPSAQPPAQSGETKQ